MSALMVVNAEINKRLGKERVDASTEEFKNVLGDFDDILQKLARRLYKAKAEYDKTQA